MGTYAAAPSSVSIGQPVYATPHHTVTAPATYVAAPQFVSATGSSVVHHTTPITYTAPPMEFAGAVPWPVATTSLQYAQTVAAPAESEAVETTGEEVEKVVDEEP